MTDVPIKIGAGALACICISITLILSVETGGQTRANEPLVATGSHARGDLSASSGAGTAAADSSHRGAFSSGNRVSASTSEPSPGAEEKDSLHAANLITGQPIATEASVQFKIGSRLEPELLHVVTRPGLYGMGRPPPGNRYGIINGRLIRFDPETMKVLSVIRDVDEILD